ncbi:MAG TPA: hypothetical protein VMS12_08215 [Thermoanaerobaculia bacterium]|nr:hypothetical protein [Thermoanaerobaculia bacterium]
MTGSAYIVRMAVIFGAALVFLGTSFLPIAAINSHGSSWNGHGTVLHRTFHHNSGFSEFIDGLFALFFCSSCMGVLVVLSLLPVLISVLIAIWMYNDARRRGDPNAVVWALLGLIFNVVGWLIYLIVRGNGNRGGGAVQQPPGSDIPPPGP